WRQRAVVVVERVVVARADPNQLSVGLAAGFGYGCQQSAPDLHQVPQVAVRRLCHEMLHLGDALSVELESQGEKRGLSLAFDEADPARLLEHGIGHVDGESALAPGGSLPQ